jgi:hypothetical protein
MLDMESDEVVAQVDVLHTGVEFVVHGKGYGSLVIAVQGRRDRWGLV